ncbi:MAG: MAPEG family protein [Caulobacterales bacterium]
MTTLTTPVISSITAGVLIILQMALMLAVARLRGPARQSLGDGGNPVLLAAMRRHGNLAENAAMFVAALTLMELMGAARWYVLAVAGVFLAARISHAIGLSLKDTVNPWRIAGAIGTVTAGVALGGRLILIAVAHLHA